MVLANYKYELPSGFTARLYEDNLIGVFYNGSIIANIGEGNVAEFPDERIWKAYILGESSGELCIDSFLDDLRRHGVEEVLSIKNF